MVRGRVRIKDCWKLLRPVSWDGGSTQHLTMNVIRGLESLECEQINSAS